MSFGQSYKNQTGDSGTSGFILLTGDAMSQGYKIASTSTKSPTIIRILPEVDQSNGNIMPYRFGNGIGEFTNWIVALETAVMGINGTISFICQLKDPNDPNKVQPVRLAVPPPTLFHKRMKELVKDPRYAAWHVHLQGETGKAASIQPTQRCGFVQGFIVYNGGQAFNPPMVKQVLVLRKTARQALEDACTVENPQQMWGNDPNHPHRFYASDFLDPSSGRLVTFKLSGADSHAQPASAAALAGSFSNFNPNAFSGAGHDDKRGNREFQRYTCEIAPPNQVSALDPQWVKQFWQPWEKLLQLHSEGDQVLMMARVIPKEMLVAAIGDEPWFPQSLKTGIVYNAPTGPVAPAATWNPNAPAPAWNPGAPANIPVPGYPPPSVPGLTLPGNTPPGPAFTPNSQYPGYAANTGFPPAEMPAAVPAPASAFPNPPAAAFPGGWTPPNPPGNVMAPPGHSYPPANPAVSNVTPPPYPYPGYGNNPAGMPGNNPAGMPGNPNSGPSFFPGGPAAPSTASMNVPPTAFDPASAPPPPVTSVPMVSVPAPANFNPAAPAAPGYNAAPPGYPGTPPGYPPANPAAATPVLNPAAPAAPGFGAPPGANPNTAATLEAMRRATANAAQMQAGQPAPPPGPGQ